MLPFSAVIWQHVTCVFHHGDMFMTTHANPDSLTTSRGAHIAISLPVNRVRNADIVLSWSTSTWGKPQESIRPRPLPLGNPSPPNDHPNRREQRLQEESPVPFPPLVNQRLPTQAEQDTPPTTPTNQFPESQLGLELQSHIAAAVASRTAQIKTTGDEVLELVHTISQKISRWEGKSLHGADLWERIPGPWFSTLARA